MSCLNSEGGQLVASWAHAWVRQLDDSNFLLWVNEWMRSIPFPPRFPKSNAEMPLFFLIEWDHFLRFLKF